MFQIPAKAITTVRHVVGEGSSLHVFKLLHFMISPLRRPTSCPRIKGKRAVNIPYIATTAKPLA